MHNLRLIDKRYPDRFSPRTVLARALASAFFATNVAFAHTAEANFWSERRRSAAHTRTGTLMASVPGLHLPAFLGGSQLLPTIEPQLPEKIRKSLSPSFLEAQDDLLKCLPYADGFVRKISTPSRFSPQGPVIIHIQDVHQNQEAQRHIASAVASLASRVDVIGLEGSTRTIDLARFRAFPDRNALTLAAQESLAQNEITGPIHAALTSKNPFPTVLGIDDPVHYVANIEAYRRSAPRMANEKTRLSSLKLLCENEKRRVFNPALLAFDRTVSDHREGRISLSAYLKRLTEGATGLSPGLLRFKEALAIEERLDFRAVESERAQAVEILAARLDADSVAQLTAQGAAYRAGRIRYGDFYRFLKNLCARHGVLFGKELDIYVRYVLLADSVDVGSLFDEMKVFEGAAYNRLTKTPAETELVARSRQIYLTEKLVAFSLTPEEWQEYQFNPTPDLASFESFYREAHARDNAMATNLLSAFSRNTPRKSGSVGILVTGGYHTPGLTNQLTKAGATVISFVPKIEKVDTADGQLALGIFTQEKTPLQKLFEGEKLFLGDNPLNASAEEISIPAKIAMAANRDPKSTLSGLMPNAVLEKIVSIKKTANALELQMNVGTFSVSWNPQAPIGQQLTTAVVMVSTAGAIWAMIQTVLHWFPFHLLAWAVHAPPSFQLGFLFLLISPVLYFGRNHIEHQKITIPPDPYSKTPGSEVGGLLLKNSPHHVMPGQNDHPPTTARQLPFNSMDRFLSSLAWGLGSANGLLFGLNLLTQGDLILGGGIGVLMIYPALIALQNLLDSTFASLSSALLIAGGPRGPPDMDEDSIRSTSIELGLNQFHIVSTLEELNKLEKGDDRLVIVSPHLLSNLAKERHHLLPFATHGLTDFQTQTVYVSDLFFRSLDNRVLSWVQAHVRSIVVARERQRLSSSPFRRSAFAIDLLLAFQRAFKPNYLNTSPSRFRRPLFFETTVGGNHFRLPTVRAYTFSGDELDAFFGDSSTARAPLVLDLNFPSGCNARCLYCFTEAGRTPHEIRFNAQAVKPKLSAHDTQEIIRQFAAEGGRVVFLCSEGEPLTNPKKFLELAHLAKSNGLRVITFTNMITITPEFARQLREAEVSLVVKFEHLDPKINSAIIRPTSDYVYVEWKGQHVPKPFVDLWNAYDGAHDMLAVSSMVTKKNVDNLLSIRRWAYEELGIAHFVKKVNFHGFAEKNRSELELTLPETRAFERALSEYDAQFGFIYPADLPDAYSFDIRRFLNNAINPKGFPARMYFHPRDGSYHSAGLVQPVFAVSPQVEVNIRSQSGEIALGNFFQTVQETIHLYRSLLEGKEEEFWNDVQRGPTELDSERRNDRREAAYQASRVLGKFLRLNWSVLDLRQRDLLQGLFYDSKRLARESTLYSVPSRPGLYRVPKAELRRALPKGEEFMFFSLHRKFPFYSSPYQVTVALTPPRQEQEIHGHFLTRELTVSLGEGLFLKVFRFKGGEVREEETFPIPPFYGTDYGARTPHLIGNNSDHPVRNITVKYGEGVVDRWSLEEGPSERAYTYDRSIKKPEVDLWGDATVYRFRKPQITSRIFVIPPGKSMDVPFDLDGERGLFIAQGQAQGSDGKESVDLMEGDILYAIHREGAAPPLLQNVGNEPAILYAVDLAENRDKGLQFPVRRWKGLSPSLFPLGIGTIWMGRVWPEGDENYQIPKKEELEKYLNDAFHLTAGSSDRLMIDTAAGYGHSERHLGAYFRTHPVEFNRALIATKWGVRYDPESGLSSLDHSVENLDASLTQSAQDLGRVDVLYIHGTTVDVLGDQAVWRRMWEIRESHEGGVQAIGVSLSNRNGESVLEALTKNAALESLDVVQLPGDVLLKRPDLVSHLTNRGVAIVLHSPMKLPMQAPPCDKYRALLGDGSAPIVLTGTRAHLDETIHYVVENDGEPNVMPQVPSPLHGGVMHWVQDLWNRSVPSTLKMDRRRWHRWAFLTEGVLSLVMGGVVAAGWVAITGDYGHLSAIYSRSVLASFVGGHVIDFLTSHRAQAPPHLLISLIIAGFSSLPLFLGGSGGDVLFLFFFTHWFVNWIMARFQSAKPGLLSWRVPVQAKSGPSMNYLAEQEAQNTIPLFKSIDTATVSGIFNAWPYQGSLQMRQSDGVRWLRSMNGSLGSSAFRKTYGMALAARRSEFPRFDGPTDLFNRFLRSLTEGVPDSTRATVPLDIISGNDLAGVARMLSHLDNINQASKTPIQIVFAGATPEDVQKLQALKLNGPRGYVHVVDVPVAPKSVLDPHVLSQGIERLADFPTNVPVSWALAVSPKISIIPSTLGQLGDLGLDGSLKEALAIYIAQLIGGRLKPADLDTMVDIVALVWQSA